MTVPGFPRLASNMTTREHFAGLALLGLLGQHVTDITESGIPCQEPLFQGDDPQLCKRAVEIADKLMVQLHDGSGIIDRLEDAESRLAALKSLSEPGPPAPEAWTTEQILEREA